MRNILIGILVGLSICNFALAQDSGWKPDRDHDHNGFGLGTGFGLGVGLGVGFGQSISETPQTPIKKRTRKGVTGSCLANIKEIKGSIPTMDYINCYADPGDKCTGSCKLKDSAGSDVSQPAKIPHLSGSAYSCSCE